MHEGPQDPSPYTGVTPPPSTQPHPSWLAAPPAPQPPRRSKAVPVLVGLLALALVVVAGLVVLQETGPAPSTSESDPTPVATTPCAWLPSGDGAVVDVGVPPTEVPAEGTVTLEMATSAGGIGLALDRSVAPCAAASFVHLAEQGFFDDSPCHRVVNMDTFGVLQCGDPTGTGAGGPPYRYAEEVSPSTTYPRGTIAMANSGTPGSTGSQFFLCFEDSQLPPDYTVVGSVDDPGLAVIDEIAAAGNDGSFEPSPGGGAPNRPVVVERMTVEG